MIAAVLASVAVLVGWPGPARRRRRRLLGEPRPVRVGAPVVAAALVPVLGLLLGGLVGLAAGVAVAPIAHRQVASLESARSRRHHAAVRRQVPLALDLMAAVLTAGRSPHDAVRLVAAHTPAPLGAELLGLAHRARLASDPSSVWRTLDGGPLEPVGRAFARSAASGAAIVPVVLDAAADLRRRSRAERREVVGRVGVRTAGPLGLCLLPAFVLVGIAPTVIAVVGSVLG